MLLGETDQIGQLSTRNAQVLSPQYSLVTSKSADGEKGHSMKYQSSNLLGFSPFRFPSVSIHPLSYPLASPPFLNPKPFLSYRFPLSGLALLSRREEAFAHVQGETGRR